MKKVAANNDEFPYLWHTPLFFFFFISKFFFFKIFGKDYKDLTDHGYTDEMSPDREPYSTLISSLKNIFYLWLLSLLV